MAEVETRRVRDGAPGDPPVAAEPRRVRVRAPGEPRRVAYLYLAPAFVFYLLFAFGPLVYTTWLSFFEWDGLTVGTWVGLDNYDKVLSDPDIRASFVHSFVLIVFYAVLPCVLGLLLASVIAHSRVRGVTFFRAVLFLPQTIATVVVAIAWVWIYAPDGPLNEALRAVGLGSLARGWLGDFDLALPALGLVGTWVMFGLCLVLFLAGIQKIPIIALRGGAGRRRGPRARVLRGHAARPARRARGRAHADDDHGAADVRPDLRLDARAVPARRPRCRPCSSTRTRSRTAASAWPRRSRSC